jgi:hypothetical protein
LEISPAKTILCTITEPLWTLWKTTKFLLLRGKPSASYRQQECVAETQQFLRSFVLKILKEILNFLTV